MTEMKNLFAMDMMQKGKRIDNRKFDEFRPIEIQTNVIQKAEGSARVKIGDTEVLAGVKMNVGEPFEDTPNEGVLIVNSEFTPLASPDFESGPPGEDSIELARIVDRGIRESKCVEFDKLAITPGEKVWMIFIDLHMINHQGNLLDCAALAAISALSTARIPKYENDAVVRGEYAKKLPVVFKPINITVSKIVGNYLLDPSLEEETVIEKKLSVAVRDDDKVCALQKQGKEELEIEELEKMIEIAIKKSKELRKLVK